MLLIVYTYQYGRDIFMNYNHLQYFQTLAKYEHYHKAAECLHITQPSLSNAIHSLEKDLGVALFEKAGRGVRLTKQGARFLEYVNNAFQELRIGTQLLSYEQLPPDSYLRLGIVMSVANDPFPKWVRKFREISGKQQFYSCMNATSDALSLELKAGNLDLIICSELDDSRILFTPLFQQKLILLMPKGHRLTGRRSVDIHELEGEAFIAHTRSSALHDILADIYRRNHIQVKIVSEADEDRAIIGMVRAGLGCGVTTYSSEIYGSDFSSVPITGSGFNGQICVGKRMGAALSGTAQVFYDFLIGSSDLNTKA